MAVTELLSAPKMFGAYVESISASIGWGGQGGSCQMSLVEDPGNDVRISLPAVGTAAYFKYHGFYYGGIFQRHTYREAIEGRKYDIILESPGGKVLDGVNVILSNFEGTGFNEGGAYNKFAPYNNPSFTTEAKNIWNPYGHKENWNFGGRFGLANTNSAGFLAGELLDLMELMSVGGSNFGGKISFGQSEYELDLTELKSVPSFFRIAGQSATLSSIIQECVDVLLLDYFAEIIPKSGVPSTDGGGVIDDPVIRIRTVEKKEQPTPGRVAAIVEEEKGSGTLVSSDVGEELSDEITQRLVVGGPASRYYVANINDCFPIWGKTATKQYILGDNLANVPQGYQLGAKVKVILDEYDPFSRFHNATVAEIRMATAGYESWITFKVFESIANGTYDSDPWVAGVDFSVADLQEIATGNRGGLSLASTSLSSAQKAYDPEIQEYTKRIFDKVQNVANTFYGKMFLVPLPAEPGGISNNLKFVEEDIQEISAWDISDSAWTTQKPIFDVMSYDSNGRLKSLSVYPIGDNYDYSDMGSEYAIWDADETPPGLSTTKSGPAEPNVFYIGNRPYIVVDTAVQIKDYDSNTTPDFGLTFLAQYFFGITIPPANYINSGKDKTQIMVPPAITYPDWIGVPQESSRYSWGPWYDSSATNGKSEVVFDTSLVPETFGSVEAMNQAGSDAAKAGNSALTANESGRIELARFPQYNIADRFAGSGPYVTGMSISVSTGGISTSYEFNTWTPRSGKLEKYNADRISRIYKGTLGAIQKIRSERPRRPFKPVSFEKTDFKEIAERLKRNRGGGEVGLMSLYNNPHVESSFVDLSDAFGLALQKFSDSFGCTDEQKWSPVGTRKTKLETDSGTYFQLPAEISEEEEGRFFGGKVMPSSEDLDPYFSKIIFNDPGTMISGSDFEAVINAVGGNSVDLQLRKAGSVDEIRSVGLRAPLMLSGWGFDIAGNPVPSLDDDITKFNTETVDGHPAVLNRRFWKTGPVNLMWDDERKVWAGGLDILSGVLSSNIDAPTSPLDPTTFEVKVFRKTDSEKGADGVTESEELVTCYNRDPSLSQAASDNVFVMIIRINYEWLPLWVGCP